MHSIIKMATLLPIQQMVINADNPLPDNEYFVITNTNKFVTTNTGANVIAQHS